MADHTANLNRGAVRLLASMLMSPGWYDESVAAARACAILELPEFDQPEPKGMKADTPELLAWEKEPVVVTLTERQRDTVKACIEKMSKQGRLQLGHAAGRLFREFGFEPKEA